MTPPNTPDPQLIPVDRVDEHEFTDPNARRTAQLLVAVEARHDAVEVDPEESGHDTLPPTLYIAFNRHGQLAIMPIALDREHPRPVLVGLAHAATSTHRWPEIARYYPAPPLAHLYLVETFPAPGAPSSDLPIRIGFAISNTAEFVITRSRGHQPELRAVTPESAVNVEVIPRALRQLHSGALRSYLSTITGSSTS